MQTYKALKSKQSLGAAVLSKTSASSVTGGGTPGRYVECSESRRWRGRLFHWRGPATVNERSTRLVRVLGTSHVATLDELAFNALSHRQAMNLPQDGRDVLTTSSISNKKCCSMLYGSSLYCLKTFEEIVRDTEQQRVTVVKTRRDECINHCLRNFGRQHSFDRSELLSSADMCKHGQLAVDVHSEISSWASTPFKPWSKCLMKNLRGRTLANLGGGVDFR